jgi:hypothetical protein
MRILQLETGRQCLDSDGLTLGDHTRHHDKSPHRRLAWCCVQCASGVCDADGLATNSFSAPGCAGTLAGYKPNECIYALHMECTEAGLAG